MTILLPVSILLPLASSLLWSLGLYALYAFFSAGIMASMAVPIQMSLPNDMQARGVAIFSLLMSALAGSIGPLLVGLLSDAFALRLGEAMATVACTSASLALILMVRALRAAREQSSD